MPEFGEITTSPEPTKVKTSAPLKVGQTVPGNVVRGEFGEIMQLPSQRVGEDISGEKTFYTPHGPTGSDIKPTKWAEPVFETIRGVSPFLRGFINYTGGGIGATGGAAVGGTLGGPTGALVGGVAGRGAGAATADQLYQNVLQRNFPRAFGSMPGSFEDSLLDTGINAGAEMLFSPEAWKLVKTGAGKIISRHENPLTAPSREALKNAPEMEGTLGQLTGNRAIQVAETVLGGSPLLQRVNTQRGKILTAADKFLQDVSGGKFSMSSIVPDIAESSVPGATNARKAAHQMTQYRYAEFDQALPNEVDTVMFPTKPTKAPPPGFTIGSGGTVGGIPGGPPKPMQIEGPVDISNTLNKMTETANSLRAEIENPIFKAQNGPAKYVEAQKALDLIDGFVQNTPFSQTTGNPTVDFMTANSWKKSAKNILASMPEEALKDTRYQAIVKDFRESVAHDIKDSAFGTAATKTTPGRAPLWSPETATKYQAALTSHATEMKNFANAVGVQLRSQDPNIAKDFIIEDALKSRTTTRNLVRALDGDKTVPATAFVQNLLNDSMDFLPKGGSKFLNGEKAIAALDEATQKGVTQTLLSSDQQSALKYLIQKARAVDPRLSEEGKVAANIRKIGAAIGLGGGLVTYATTGNIPSSIGAGTALMGLVGLGSKGVKNLFLNPENARLLANLHTAPVGSSMATSMTKKLFKNLRASGLRAIPISLMGQNDYSGEAEINENGTLTIQQPPGEGSPQ